VRVTAIDPGWYKDPADPATQRYWDGEGWVGDPLPVDATPPAGPPPSAQPAEPPQPRVAPHERDQPPVPAAPAGVAVGQPSGPAPARPPAGPPPAGWPPSVPWPPPVMPQPPPGYPLPPAYARMFLPPPRPHGYALAAVGRRFAARMVDIGLLLIANAVVNGWFIYRFFQEFWPYFTITMERAQAGRSFDDVPQPQDIGSLTFTITLIAAGLWFAYEVPAMASQGQTVGKKLLGIKVLRLEEDGPLGFGRAMRRWNLLGFATLLWTYGIGFIFQFVDCLFVAIDQPLHQALHDKSAATVVVDVHDPQPVEKPGGSA
jgi:uncharacterized RDD family membrane protein YckC